MENISNACHIITAQAVLLQPQGEHTYLPYMYMHEIRLVSSDQPAAMLRECANWSWFTGRIINSSLYDLQHSQSAINRAAYERLFDSNSIQTHSAFLVMRTDNLTHYTQQLSKLPDKFCDTLFMAPTASSTNAEQGTPKGN